MPDSKTVRVRLVWPAERGAKDDCQANTGIVWSAAGDVQDFPADKWHLLAGHPDVWQLVDEADAAKAEAAEHAPPPEVPVATVTAATPEIEARAIESGPKPADPPTDEATGGDTLTVEKIESVDEPEPDPVGLGDARPRGRGKARGKG